MNSNQSKKSIDVDLAEIKIYKRKSTKESPYYHGRYKYKSSDGTTKYISIYGKSKAIIIKKFKERYKTYNSKYSEAACSPEATLQQFTIYWLNNVKKYEIRPQSIEVIMRTYNNYVDKRLGNRSISSIKRYELQEVINSMQYQLSISTIKKVKDYFHAIFSYAHEEKILECNVAKDLKLPRSIEEEENDPFDDESKTMVFSKEEINAFKTTADLRKPNGDFAYKYGYIFLFLLNSGLRIGEMLALKWKDVDFDKGFIKVYKTVSYGDNSIDAKYILSDKGRIEPNHKPTFFVQNRPKSKSSVRKVYLLPDAKKYLTKYKEKYYTGEDRYIVYPNNGNGMSPLSKSSMRNRFNQFKAASGVTNEATIHALRHTFATTLYNDYSMRLVPISRSLGHSSTKVTSDTYINVFNKDTY